MSNYDQQYTLETELFGEPYPEFEAFVRLLNGQGKTALDMGCGQGRDALMLARHGYNVTGVDASAVGIQQMEERAKRAGLAVKGLVASFYDFVPDTTYDAIVLDSILHFEKADRERERALLDRLLGYLNPQGYLFIFVHKSGRKEAELHEWLQRNGDYVTLVQDGYLAYVYEEKQIDFRSTFQMYMFVVQRVAN